MKRIQFAYKLTILVFALAFGSCENEGNDVKISKRGEDESHKSGQNCMNCHVSGGSGEGWFQVAGTVYDGGLTHTLSNATVRMHTQANGAGELTASFEGDKLGNFYSTD